MWSHHPKKSSRPAPPDHPHGHAGRFARDQGQGAVQRCAEARICWSSGGIPKTGEYQQDLLRWGLIPNWTKDVSPKLKPINATAERVATAPMFREAYARRRCIVPVDNFFEWKAVKGAKAKQPYAIALKSGKPFGIAGIWESWKHPKSGEIIRTFCIITTTANELVADIHDRMPVILPPEAYDRWLANIEPDPRDLLAPFPAELMTMWPISTRVNKPDNDDPGILDPVRAGGGRVADVVVSIWRNP